MPRKSLDIKLSLSEINALTELANSVHDPIIARRAKIILECNEGKSNKEISASTGMNEADVGRWRKTYAANGIESLRGKSTGGNNQYGSPNKEIEAKLDDLLNQGDSWTVKSLAEEIGSTPSIISGLLRKKGITLQRKRQWEISTQDELVPKNVDIVGLFISHSEQILIMCCAKDAVPQCNGEIITRNRELYNDFAAYKGTISLTDAINTAIAHINDKSALVSIAGSDFLNQTLSLFPQDDSLEYHILIHSSKDAPYRRARFKGIYQNWADDISEWLQVLDTIIDELADRSQLNVGKELYESIASYLENCTSTTNPFLWRKVPTSSVNISSAVESATKEQESKPFLPGTDHSPILDDLREVLAKHISQGTLDSEVVRCGFISFAYDKNDIRVHIDEDQGNQIKSSNYNVESVESCCDSLSSIEDALIKIREESGIHAAEMTVDLLKKKQKCHRINSIH